MRIMSLLTLCMVTVVSAVAQQRVTVLFVGNSYIYVNNLPQLIANIATSKGDTLTFDSNTIGGYTLQQHNTNTTTQSKIAAQPWDYVVLQEQSQLPSFAPAQVAVDVYPFADSLVRKVRASNSCTTPIFYMTWGRQNGDASNCANYTPVCTYAGMQHRLHDSYLEMGQTHQAPVAPVGAVWRTVRDSFPGINLYDPDQSHPSMHGSYLSACTFYAAIFQKSPIGATYPNVINATDADNIQRIAHQMVFDSLSVWGIDTATVRGGFSYTEDAGIVSFTNASANATDYLWDFGDGATSTDANPQHQYADSGSYQVQLFATDGCDSAQITQTITFAPVGIDDFSNFTLQMFPNPASNYIQIKGIGSSSTALNIYSYNGQKIVSQAYPQSGLVDVATLPAGIYMVEMVGLDGSVARGKFLLER